MDFCTDLKEQKIRLEKSIPTYQNQIENYNKALRELYMDKALSNISQEEYFDLYNHFSDKRSQYELLIDDTEQKIQSLDERIAIGDDRPIIEKYINFEHLTREMVEILIDYVSVGRRIEGTRTIPVKIHWKF